jgi:hypothetical protein
MNHADTGGGRKCTLCGRTENIVHFMNGYICEECINYVVGNL